MTGLWSALAVNAVQGSGLGDLSRSELNRFLEDRTVSLNAFIGETVEGFAGRASIEDVETMFQLIHLLVTAPRVDEQAYADAIHTAETRVERAERDPSWQAVIAYLEARYDNTWHRAIASLEEIESLTPQRLLDMYKSRLGSVDDLVVAVVGGHRRSGDRATGPPLHRHASHRRVRHLRQPPATHSQAGWCSGRSRSARARALCWRSTTRPTWR